MLTYKYILSVQGEMTTQTIAGEIRGLKYELVSIINAWRPGESLRYEHIVELTVNMEPRTLLDAFSPWLRERTLDVTRKEETT